MPDINSRQRILKLMDILKNETDQDQELSFEDIAQKFKFEFGEEYQLQKRAFREDVEVLRNIKFEVIENVGKYGAKFYSYQNRPFDFYELRMLIDAVISARFITHEESKKLIEKIKKLTSRKNASHLQNSFFLKNTIKSDYKQVKFEIDKLHTAIANNKKIKFQYGKYNIKKEFVLQRDQTFYDVKPYAMVWNNDYYYLIGQFELENDIRHYRVDRIRNVKIEDESFIKDSFDLQEYVKKSFHMYSGREETIQIYFKTQLINVIIDRFGLDADIKEIDQDWFMLRTRAAISEGLIRWILTWGSDAKVLSPSHLVDKLKEESEKMHKLYN